MTRDIGFPNTSSMSLVVNGTLIQVSGPHWTFLPVFYCIIAISAFSSNLLVLTTFLRNPQLRTSFNIYLINLTAGNILHAALHNVADIINNLYSGWWLGAGYCGLFVYVTYVFEAGIRYCHLVITVNRLWAVLRPVSYRHYHTKRVAILLCAISWMYVHVTLLPGVLRDALYFRLPLVVNPCFLNARMQWEWAFGVQIAVYDWTVVFMVGAYPAIWYHHHKRKHARNGTASQPRSIESGSVGTQNSISVVDEQASSAARTRVKKSTHGFVVLTLLTVSVSLCWTPLMAYYTVHSLIDISSPWWLRVAVVLLGLQTTLDPVLFVVALPELRAALFRCLLYKN